jgi:hypothetical protein
MQHPLAKCTNYLVPMPSRDRLAAYQHLFQPSSGRCHRLILCCSFASRSHNHRQIISNLVTSLRALEGYMPFKSSAYPNQWCL